MAKGKVLINGVGYSNSDVSVNLLGRTVEGMRAIDFGIIADKSHTKGRGGEDTERLRNSKSRKPGSVTVTFKEAAAIRRVLPIGKDVTDIKPFPIVITVVNDENIPVIITIQDVEFTEDSFNHEVEGEGLMTTFGLILGQITQT